MRFKALFLSFALALLLVPSGAPLVGADKASACADISQALHNFKVVAEWHKPSAKIGSVAKMDVYVERTAETDPATGSPWPNGRPVVEPVEGVSVGVGLLINDVFFAAGGLTDAEGKVTVKMKIENYAKPGTGITRVFAKKDRTPPDFPSSSCRVVVYEYGQLQPGPELKITR